MRTTTTTTTSSDHQATTLRRRAIGTWGTAGRVVFGVGLVVLAALQKEGIGLHTLVVAGLLTAGVAAVQVARTRYTNTALDVTNPVAHWLNIVLFAVLASFELTRTGLFVFYGASALVAAARGVAGCEVTAITNWLFRRNDQVGCVLFGPVDALEASHRRPAER